MSAWMSPHRFSVHVDQLRLANRATITASRTQNRVLRNCMVGHLGEPRVQRQQSVRRACRVALSQAR